MTERYKINEIFYSLQGEGYHTGMAAVFIRFSGCNLRCSFCDTQHKNGDFYTVADIIERVMKYPQSPLIVLTGGEPSLFISEDFVDKLKKSTGMTIAIETNGTNPIPSNIDWVTLSPKKGFAGGDCADMILNSCDELKVVFANQRLEPYFTIKANYRFLQPCFTGNTEADRINTEETIAVILKDPRWQLSLQTHKLLSIR